MTADQYCWCCEKLIESGANWPGPGCSTCRAQATLYLKRLPCECAKALKKKQASEPPGDGRRPARRTADRRSEVGRAPTSPPRPPVAEAAQWADVEVWRPQCSYSDSAYLRELGDALLEDRMDDEDTEKLDKLLRSYHLATQMWLEQHGWGRR